MEDEWKSFKMIFQY